MNETGLKLQEMHLVGNDALSFIFQAQKNFLRLATSYLISNVAQKNLPGASSFTTSLITYINRMIIADTAFFVGEILAYLNQT